MQTPPSRTPGRPIRSRTPGTGEASSSAPYRVPGPPLSPRGGRQRGIGPAAALPNEGLRLAGALEHFDQPGSEAKVIETLEELQKILRE